MKYYKYKKTVLGLVSLIIILGFVAVFDSFVIPYVDNNKKLSNVVSFTDYDSSNHRIKDAYDEGSVVETTDIADVSDDILINSVGLFDSEIERIERSLDAMEEDIDSIDTSIDKIRKTDDKPQKIHKEKIDIKKINEIRSEIREQSKDLLFLIQEKNNEKIQKVRDRENLKFISNEKETSDIIEVDLQIGIDNNLDHFEDYAIKDLRSEFEGVFDEFFDIETKTAIEIIELEKIAVKKKKVIERVEKQTESVLSILRDSDKDGVSDYDEIHIYETDPTSMDTDNDGYFDGVEIMTGFNPTDELNLAVEYENPKESEIIVSDEILFVEEIKVVKIEGVTDCIEEDCTDVINKVEFTGRALPNSFVTLYIFSIPTVVTVKTDRDGNWNYVLDKELEDGVHEIYVAMTDSYGKIVTKSSPASFNKQAAVVTMNENLLSLTVENETPSFFNDSFIYITLLGILLAISIMLVFSGGMGSRDDEINDNNIIS